MQRRGSVNGSAAAGSRIRVAVRVRPPNFKIPKDESRPPCVAPHAYAANAVEFHHEAQAKTFTFDHVFGSDANQEDVYANALQPLMAQFLDGYNVTVMAYGQTGSGKTHTMGNKATVFNTTPTTSPCRDRDRVSSLPAPTVMAPGSRIFPGSADDGLMPRFLNDLFVNLKKEPSIREIRVTFVEIYCDTIRDLLDDHVSKTLTLRDDSHNVWVENVRTVQVDTLARALEVLNDGRSRQTVASNALNDESSRSHAVYTMEVTRKFQSETKKSKVTFVDLAGSERIKKTQVEGVRKRESVHINLGLSALGNVINALADEKKMQRRGSQDSSLSHPSSPDTHIPYRSSKLTRLLRDGLGGNARTLFIACVSPLDSNSDETLVTLQFANRARNIQNKAEKCVHLDHLVAQPSPMELENTRLEEEVKRLTVKVEELELAARQKDHEMEIAEQARMSRRQKKIDDRRDTEMTTEIIISPHVDAHTQVEGENSEERNTRSTVQATMTDIVGEIKSAATVVVDLEVQAGLPTFAMADAEMMTEPDAANASTDVCTDCDGLGEPSVDSELQVGPSYSHRVDTDIATDPEPTVNVVDASTDSCSPSFVHVESQCEFYSPQTVDMETVTDIEPAADMSDKSTECLDSPTVETGCQSDNAGVDAIEAVTMTEWESVDASTECDPEAVEDFETQSDVSREDSASAGPKQSCPTGEESESVQAGVTSCPSDQSIIELNESSKWTYAETAVVSVDVCQHCSGRMHEACMPRSAIRCPEYVDSGISSDTELAPETVDACTQCHAGCVVDSSTQPDVIRSSLKSVGTFTEELAVVETKDACVVNVSTEITRQVAPPLATLSSDAASAEGALVSRSDEKPDCDASDDDGSGGPPSDPSHEHVVDGLPSLPPPSDLNTVRSKREELQNGAAAPGAATNDSHANMRDVSSAVQSRGELGYDGGDAGSRIKLEGGLECLKETTRDPKIVAKYSIGDSKGVDTLALQARAGCPESTISTLDIFYTELESRHEVASELFSLSAMKTVRSLTPEMHDEEYSKDLPSQSENQLEVGDAEPLVFVCNAMDDDDCFGSQQVILSTDGSDEFVLELQSGADDDELCDDFVSPLDPTLPERLCVSIRPSAMETSCTARSETEDSADSQHEASKCSKPSADFVVVRSPRGRGDIQTSPQPSPRATLSKRWCSSSSQPTLRPLRMFAFDDEIVAPAEKTTTQAKNLREELRRLVKDEFGSTSATDSDDEEEEKEDDGSPNSAVHQLMAETKQFLVQRNRRQQRITHLRRRIQKLENLLLVDCRAPISEPELHAYSFRVQEEFLQRLVEQLVTLAAERLHARLTARIVAEQTAPLPAGDDDPSCPFLTMDQCQACAEWFFHRPDDFALFDKQIMPLVANAWISLTPADLGAEQAWFQL